MYDCNMTYTVVLSNPTALYGERKNLLHIINSQRLQKIIRRYLIYHERRIGPCRLSQFCREVYFVFFFSLFLRDCCNCIVEKLELYWKYMVTWRELRLNNQIRTSELKAGMVHQGQMIHSVSSFSHFWIFSHNNRSLAYLEISFLHF